MLIFTIIAIAIIFFLWFNTSVYNYNKNKGYWDIEYMTERRLPFTLLRVIGLSLLLIPWLNIVIFAIYLLWYLKRACEPEENRKCIIYVLNIEKYSPALCNVFHFIVKILNKRIV